MRMKFALLICSAPLAFSLAASADDASSSSSDGITAEADAGPTDPDAGVVDVDSRPGDDDRPPIEVEGDTAPSLVDGGVGETDAGAVVEPGAELSAPTDASLPTAEANDTLSTEELEAISRAVGADAAKGDGPTTTPSEIPTPTAFTQGAMRFFQSMNPDMSLILDVAGALFSTPTNIQTGGHDPRVMGFNLQQLELHVASNVDPFFRFEANIVFAQFGVEVEEAYATTLALPYRLQARAGQFLTRFGRMNPTHPHSWSFADQPLVLGKFFGSEGNRGLGAELSWLAPLPWYVELVGSTTGAAGECCARSYFGGRDLGVRSPLDVLATVAVKQFFPMGEDFSAFFGVSAQSGPNPNGRMSRTEIFGTDLYLRYRPVDSPGRTSLAFQSEALVRRRQVPGDVLSDAGLYAQVVAQFMLQWELALRIDAVTGVLDDPLDPEWTGLRTRSSVQATYYPSHFSRIRLQAAYGTPGDGLAPVHETLITDPVWSCFVALEFLVGAHGSHDF
jgi:hypothetical protein